MCNVNVADNLTLIYISSNKQLLNCAKQMKPFLDIL